MRDIFVVSNEVTADVILEFWFMQNLVLQGLPVGLEWDVAALHDSVVVYFEVRELNGDVVDQLKAQNNKVILLQMGDLKAQRFRREIYQKCDLILRMHYFPEIFEDPEIAAKIVWIPNGFKSGIGPRVPQSLRASSQRRFLSCFLGWLDNDGAVGNERNAFREAVQYCASDILMHPTSAFGQGYKLGMYSVAMEYSIFAPCPAGNSPETIRLYDALELGCIPICLNHRFLHSPVALGEVPFPVLNDWSELPAFLAQYREIIQTDPAHVQALQQTCIQWWNDFKAARFGHIAERFLQLRNS